MSHLQMAFGWVASPALFSAGLSEGFNEKRASARFDLQLGKSVETGWMNLRRVVTQP